MKSGWNIRHRDGRFLLAVWVSRPTAADALRLIQDAHKKRRPVMYNHRPLDPKDCELFEGFNAFR